MKPRWTRLSIRSAPSLLIELPWKSSLLLLGLCSYLFVINSLGRLTSDHWVLCTILGLLIVAGKKVSTFLDFVFPFALTAMVYDSQRLFGDQIRGSIHVSEPYFFDRFFFGISTKHGILTPNEWLQMHTHPALDLITGFAYLIFFSVFILISAYFTFFLSRRGSKNYSPSEFKQRAQLMPWSFFLLNLLGYSTYYWFPAAPPWYVAQHGLGPALLNIPADMAGCARFDQILGTHFFSSMYGRAADVFGAIPSLHVAYPLLATYFAFQLGVAQIFCISFYLLMCFSALYLNHHYVLDILWGSLYALLTGWGVNGFIDLKKGKSNPERDPRSSPGSVP